MGGDGQHEEGEVLGVTGASGLPAASGLLGGVPAWKHSAHVTSEVPGHLAWQIPH